MEILEHPSDVGFAAEGVDLSAAVDAAVRGLATIQTGGRLPEAPERRAAEVTADDEESLVVAVLEECLFLVDTVDWLACSCDLLQHSPGRYQVRLEGAPLTPAERERGVHVKAVTWHQLSVAHRDGKVIVTVYVDI